VLPLHSRDCQREDASRGRDCRFAPLPGLNRGIEWSGAHWAYRGVEFDSCWVRPADWLSPQLPHPLSWPRRSRVFDDPCFLPRVLSTVKYATVVTNNTMGKDRPASPSLPYGSNNGLTQERTHQQRKAVPGGLVGATAPPQVLQQDPAFEAPPLQASPVAADILRRVFTVLRNSCAGCPVNNQALSHTGLAEAVKLLIVQSAINRAHLLVVLRLI